MTAIITIIIVCALIQSFLHSTRGTIHKYDKAFGGMYSMIFIALTIYSAIKYELKYLLIVPIVFFVSNFIFVTIFDKVFKR